MDFGVNIGHRDGTVQVFTLKQTYQGKGLRVGGSNNYYIDFVLSTSGAASRSLTLVNDAQEVVCQMTKMIRRLGSVLCDR